MKSKKNNGHLHLVKGQESEVQDNLTPEQAEFFEKYDGSISREDTNKILKLAKTGFSISMDGFLEYNLAHLNVGKDLEETVCDLYENIFKGKISVHPIKLTDEERELDPEMLLVLRLEIPVFDKNGNKESKMTAALDVYLQDLLYTNAFTTLLGIAYFFRNLQRMYSGFLKPSYSFIDIMEQVKHLEEELFTDDYMEYLHFQLHHANTVVGFSCGEALEENELDDKNGVAHVFLSNSNYLFDDMPLTMQDPDIDYHIVPKDFSYDVLFQNELTDIKPFLPIFAFGEDDEIPVQICIPDMRQVTETSNLGRIEIYIKHLVFLAKLKKLKRNSVGDWGDTLFNYVYLPNFEIPATLIAAKEAVEEGVE